MGKIKIHEIAKKFNLTSKEVLEVANKLNIEAKSHLSGVEEEEAKRIEEELEKNSTKQKKNNEKKTTKKEDKKDTPVIIRREVIISQDESEKNKEVEKKQEKRNSNIGFVERKTNKDYNIVYRNKPNKPMTVSELFGLKKEEPKKEEKKKEEKPKEENKTVEKTEKVEEKAKKENDTVQEEKSKKVTEKVEERKDMKTETKKVKTNNNTNYQNRNNNFNNQRKNNNFNGNSNSNRNNNRFNRNANNDRYGRRPLDEKGIEKNIKNIMSTETIEKETVREYNKNIDKQKNNNRFDENKNNKKGKNRRNSNNGNFDEGKLKTLKTTNRLSNMFDDQEGGMLDYYDLTTERGRRGKKKKNQNQEERTKQKIFKLTNIEIPETITVKDFAAEMKKTTAEVIKKLLGFGVMATINNEIDFDTAYLIAQEFGITATKKETVTEEDILFDESEDREEDLQPRPPVVVVMGHVDHGKTSLLDAIRKTNVIEGEAGGITQAIGAYMVKINDREITFLDTPGHEAFTAMRARGAQITDIAILVVAANDGVMPQTIEAINHAKSAEIPIIVAINKIDLPDANVEKVKQELMAYDLVPEEWGGDTIYVPISAKKNQNIDQLLEMVLLEADVLELKANPKKQAKGAVIEARLDKSRGAIATMLVQRGTLDVGDTIVVGSSI